MVKNPRASAGDTGDVGSVPELGRTPGIDYGNPLQYSCLEHPTVRGSCQATVHGVTLSWTQLSTHTAHISRTESSKRFSGRNVLSLTLITVVMELFVS